MRQYDDFMKQVESDPYTALFGRSWLNFGGESTEPKAARTSSHDSPRETSVSNNERTRENWPSKPKPSSTNMPEDREIGGRQSKSETTLIQKHDQEYEIDPITNRKVLKASASPVSILGDNKPHLKGGERAFERHSKRWDFVSPTPLNHHPIMVERAQVLSSSNPPSKGTSPAKQHTTKEWLVQEGFGGFQEPKGDPQPIHHNHDAKPNTVAAKIASALDRHLSSKSTSETRRSDRPELQYKPEENKTEDIDLLRPSDVRASAGLRGNSPKETNADKQERRKRLEERYESCSIDRPEVASNKLVQKGEEHPVRKDTATELRFGSWLKGTLQDVNPESKERKELKGTSAVWVSDYSHARDFDPESINQTSDSTSLSKNRAVLKSPSAIIPEPKAKVRDKASKLKAQIVPFKVKLDAMKADYDSLRQEWLQEIRILRERAAKKEKDMKAEEIAKRAREIHEEEVKTQKVAMESMEMRSNDRNTNTAKTVLAGTLGNDVARQPSPRRLQSFFQGEGDMASNVHEFAGRDRWYKRKAPHAMDAKDAEIDAKLQKVARDRALIREIRSIYEDTYGTIDTKHRQPHVLSTSQVGSSSQPITPSTGKIESHPQLPSSAVGRVNALVALQKTLGQPREAQSIIHPPTAPKSNTPEFQKASKLNTYRILAYDSATESLKSVETRIPFSKEESLLPLDALNRLSNPAKFLAHVVSLGARGYEPVSGTTNILVFKKELTPQDLAETNNDRVQSRGVEMEQDKFKKTQGQAVEKIETEHQKAEKPSKTATDGIPKEKDPLEEAQKQHFTLSASPASTSSDRVHRQETVFSGSRHGRWTEKSFKFKRSRRAAERRRKTMKRVLMAGAFTAAWCYCMGVASELMHG